MIFQRLRSLGLVRIKIFHDAEGRVVEYLPGKGRHAGRLGAIVVELPNGLTFSVGTGFTDAQRQNPPPVGSFVTYRYQEFTDRGVPRFPSFVRVRSVPTCPCPPKCPTDSKCRGFRQSYSCIHSQQHKFKEFPVWKSVTRVRGRQLRQVLGDRRRRRRRNRPFRADRHRGADTGENAARRRCCGQACGEAGLHRRPRRGTRKQLPGEPPIRGEPGWDLADRSNYHAAGSPPTQFPRKSHWFHTIITGTVYSCAVPHGFQSTSRVSADAKMNDVQILPFSPHPRLPALAGRYVRRFWAFLALAIALVYRISPDAKIAWRNI